MELPFLEFHLVGHCNLRCRGCNHASPALPREFVPLTEIARDLTELQRLGVHTPRVRLLGGEPLLHPEIVAILRLICAAGIGETVHVVTNGALLSRMPREFWEIVPLVVVSRYPGIAIMVPPEFAQKVVFQDYPEFYETFSTQRNDNAALVRKIWDRCGVRNCRGIVSGTLHRCMRAPYIARYVGLEKADGLPLADATPESVQAYLADPEPMAECDFCVGTCGKRFPHAQLPQAAWAQAQTRPVVEMLRETFINANARLIAQRLPSFAALA